MVSTFCRLEVQCDPPDKKADVFTNLPIELHNYRQTSNISSTLVGNKILDHSDVVGASPDGVAPTTSSFST